MGDLCGATTTDLLHKTVTCARPKGHDGDHESVRLQCWEDDALSVLTELVAWWDGGGYPASGASAPAPRSTWDKARKLVTEATEKS